MVHIYAPKLDWKSDQTRQTHGCIDFCGRRGMSKSGGAGPENKGSGRGGRERGNEAEGHGANPAGDRTGDTITDKNRPASGGMGMSKSGGAVARSAVTAEQSGAGAAQREAAELRPCGKRTREANQQETRRGRKGARGASSEPLGIKRQK